MKSLPQEVLAMVAKECPDSALASLARTCKALRGPAEERLYLNALLRQDLSPAFRAAGYGNVGTLKRLQSVAATFKVPNFTFAVRDNTHFGGCQCDADSSPYFEPYDLQFTNSACLRKKLYLPRGSWGATPMHQAARYGHEDVMRFLHSHGVDIEILDEQDHTPMFYAITMPGFMSSVYHLNVLGADINYVRPDGMTMLQWACERADQCLMLRLILAGADVKSEDPDGKTILHRFARRITDLCDCTEDLIGLIRDCGIDINAKNNKGNTALHVVSKRQASSLDEYTEMTKFIKMLVLAGADINAQNEDDTTPVMLSCRHIPKDGKSEDAQLRLAAFESGEDKADFEVTDSYSRNCLIHAIEANEHSGNVTCAEALQDYGVEWDWDDEWTYCLGSLREWLTNRSEYHPCREYYYDVYACLNDGVSRADELEQELYTMKMWGEHGYFDKLAELEKIDPYRADELRDEYHDYYVGAGKYAEQNN